MTNHGIAPPTNEEIDITPSGTTIATNDSRAVSNPDEISSQAFGTILLLRLYYFDENGDEQRADIDGIALPYGANTLTVTKNSADTKKIGPTTYYQAAWSTNNGPVQSSGSKRDWTTGLRQPSGATLSYQTSIDGAWTNTLPLSRFKELKFQAFVDSPS